MYIQVVQESARVVICSPAHLVQGTRRAGEQITTCALSCTTCMYIMMLLRMDASCIRNMQSGLRCNKTLDECIKLVLNKFMMICLRRLDAEQALCAQMLSFHYNALPSPILWQCIWSRICGIRWDFRSQKEFTYDGNSDRFHEQS